MFPIFVGGKILPCVSANELLGNCTQFGGNLETFWVGLFFQRERLFIQESSKRLLGFPLFRGLIRVKLGSFNFLTEEQGDIFSREFHEIPKRGAPFVSPLPSFIKWGA